MLATLLAAPGKSQHPTVALVATRLSLAVLPDRPAPLPTDLRRAVEMATVARSPFSQQRARARPSWLLQTELSAWNGASGDNFGWSVALSGNTALVGAPFKTVGSHPFQGVVYVFTDTRGTWSKSAELTARDGATGDNFGWALSLAGSTALIGALWHGTDKDPGRGAAYVFSESGGVWSQRAELTASDAAPGDNFGSSVSLSGRTALVGAYGHATGHQAERGAAYIFQEENGIWSERAELTAADGASDDNFGCSVAVSGDTAIVGAYGHLVGRGAAYVFNQRKGVWSKQAELSASDGAPGDNFGWSVSLAGTTAMFGAPGRTVGANIAQGAVYAFVLSGGRWVQRAQLTASDGAGIEQFGNAVSVSDKTALIGAFGYTVHSRSGQGAAFVFDRSRGAWSQQAELEASDGGDKDHMGWSVSLWRASALVGAIGHQINSEVGRGSVYMFTTPGTPRHQL
jgi:hypothetical protein